MATDGTSGRNPLDQRQRGRIVRQGEGGLLVCPEHSDALYRLARLTWGGTRVGSLVRLYAACPRVDVVSNFNVALQWMLVDADGALMAAWNERPTDTAISTIVAYRVSKDDNHYEPPFMLLEASRKQVWEFNPDAGDTHPHMVKAMSDSVVSPIQFGPRKVTVR